MTNYQYDEEFYLRVKHNFKVYVLLSSKKMHWKQDDILDSICRLSGYRSHKTVKYCEYSSHIYVKFQDEKSAGEAVEFLKKMNSGLTAVLADEMLRDWFSYEMKSSFGPPCTLTIVDIVGNPPFSLNFLTSNILDSIFVDFGAPYLSPYTAALQEPHVQVLFGSMTEALAACMAFGEWFGLDGKVDSFSYRVRINPSNKESLMIKHSGGIPKEAFKLDYFVNVRSELVESPTLEADRKRNKVIRSKVSMSKKSKVRKHKQTTTAEFLTQIGHRTPILCVPVIAPLNYAEFLMAASNSKLGADFANSMLNFQQSCSVPTRAIASTGESEMKTNSSIEYSEGTAELDDGKNVESPACPIEGELSEDPLPENQLQPVALKPRNNPKVHTRVFERRK